MFNSIFDAFRLLGLVKFVDTFDGFSNSMKVSTLVAILGKTRRCNLESTQKGIHILFKLACSFI